MKTGRRRRRWLRAPAQRHPPPSSFRRRASAAAAPCAAAREPTRAPQTVTLAHVTLSNKTGEERDASTCIKRHNAFALAPVDNNVIGGLGAVRCKSIRQARLANRVRRCRGMALFLGICKRLRPYLPPVTGPHRARRRSLAALHVQNDQRLCAATRGGRRTGQAGNPTPQTLNLYRPVPPRCRLDDATPPSHSSAPPRTAQMSSPHHCLSARAVMRGWSAAAPARGLTGAAARAGPPRTHLQKRRHRLRWQAASAAASSERDGGAVGPPPGTGICAKWLIDSRCAQMQPSEAKRITKSTDAHTHTTRKATCSSPLDSRPHLPHLASRALLTLAKY